MHSVTPVESELEDVLEAAFQDQGKFLDIGGVHHVAADRCQFRGLELVVVPATHEADLVGFLDVLRGRDVRGERPASQQAPVGIGGLP